MLSTWPMGHKFCIIMTHLKYRSLEVQTKNDQSPRMVKFYPKFTTLLSSYRPTALTKKAKRFFFFCGIFLQNLILKALTLNRCAPFQLVWCRYAHCIHFTDSDRQIFFSGHYHKQNATSMDINLISEHYISNCFVLAYTMAGEFICLTLHLSFPFSILFNQDTY